MRLCKNLYNSIFFLLQYLALFKWRLTHMRTLCNHPNASKEDILEPKFQRIQNIFKNTWLHQNASHRYFILNLDTKWFDEKIFFLEEIKRKRKRQKAYVIMAAQQQLSGTIVVIIIAMAVQVCIMLVIVVKRQIMRFAIRNRRGPHTHIGQGAPKVLRRETDRQLEYVAYIRHEPKPFELESEGVNHRISALKELR